MNKTLNEYARNIKLHSKLPKMFWVEAINIATYLINRRPLALLICKILEEIWSNKELKFSHLKVFDCLSYIHIDFALRKKFNSKFKKHFFIGYGDIKLDYCFWDDKNHKIVRSKDMIFNVSMLYKDNLRKDIESSNSTTNKLKVIHLKDFLVVESQYDVKKIQKNKRGKKYSLFLKLNLEDLLEFLNHQKGIFFLIIFY